MAKLGEILIEKGWISAGELDEVFEESRQSGEFLGKTLLRKEMLSEAQLLEALGIQMAIPFYPKLDDNLVEKDIADEVPIKLVWHYKVMPISRNGSTLTIAVSDPMEVWSIEDLELRLGFHVERVLATTVEIESAIRKYYGFGASTVEDILSDKEVKPTSQTEDVQDVDAHADDASVVKLVNQLISDAITSRATDIHIEPYRESIKVRYRVDGQLYDINVPDSFHCLLTSIVSRIKIISGLDVVEKRLPQDGRAIVKLQGEKIDLRISIIPSIYGESVVIRILPTSFLFDLEQLGYFPEHKNLIEKYTNQPHGIVFLTGPTGSGKSTTLYACLSRLNKESLKIVTLEDPVEYEIEGITQIQMRPEIDFSFATALRSVLRHDPDVMMIGEVRDYETAELAIRTSLTGHLMFSTLHTNDAASGAVRLMDIGVEPYLIASSVNAFIAQRLVRKICPNCKVERKDTSMVAKEFEGCKVFYGKGCDECNGLGYSGRTTLYEILPVSSTIQNLILKKASAKDIAEESEKLKNISFIDIARKKVTMGITTPEEAMQVIGQ